MRLHRRDRTLHKDTQFSQLYGVFADQIRCWATARSITDKQTGDPVTLWKDDSPRAFDFKNYTGNPPTYNANGINGYPSVRFTSGVTGVFSTDTVSDSNGNTAIFGWGESPQPGWVTLWPGYARTMAMVYVPRSTNCGTMLQAYHSIRDQTGGPHPNWWGGTSYASLFALENLTIGDPYILVVSNHGRCERYWINGVPQGSVYYGIYYGSKEYMNVPVRLAGGTYDVGEVFLARYAIGPKEIILLTDYFARKYSFTVGTATWIDPPPVA
jgi:hypothetical protein